MGKKSRLVSKMTCLRNSSTKYRLTIQTEWVIRNYDFRDAVQLFSGFGEVLCHSLWVSNLESFFKTFL